ncbi:hypothetical protein LY78DRAFT_494580 [Colletotrichum sublineola]|nr:hypothetical protein LY78DRAFT_494580 [Colletotrichum sublineola]
MGKAIAPRYSLRHLPSDERFIGTAHARGLIAALPYITPIIGLVGSAIWKSKPCPDISPAKIMVQTERLTP